VRRLVSLFSGVGLLDHGLAEGAGLEPVAFAEANEWCRAVLRWLWPHFARIIGELAPRKSARSADAAVDAEAA
jgi:site-specific DNA-cytosine methylase